MIVVCPNCGARYQLADGVSVVGKRMRCADCEHRWVVEAVAEAVVPEPEPAPVVVAEPEPEPVTSDEPEDEPKRWGWVVAALAGVLVLATGFVAAGVALERIDPARVPVVGGVMAGLRPGPSVLVIEATGRLTPLPNGVLLLEVSGAVTNGGREAVDVRALKATLEGADRKGAGNVARRWTIVLPVARLAAGESAKFSSTLTDVPGGATRLRLTTG